MLKLSLLEFFARLIPESLLFILASYTFSGKKVDKNNYFMGSLLLMIVILAIRFLPVNYGVHTLVNIIMLTVIIVAVNKIEVIRAIKSSIVTTISLFMCEAVSIVVLKAIFKDSFEEMLSNHVLNTICSLPSLVLFAIIIICYYRYLKRAGKLENV